MKFSIITPSFRTREWLPLCAASVRDQQGVTVEHLVQDAGSDDGTVEWLRSQPDISSVIERDGGMYDAINRGLRRASGEILAHLNADEQYLPGALQAVAAIFAAHPDLDLVLADTVVVDAAGKFICCRKSMKPLPWLRYTQNPTITSSIFFRRRVVTEEQLFFDTQWRIVGDAVWIREAQRRRLKMAVLRRYTSTFTDSGANLDLTPKAREESDRLRSLRPRWAEWLDAPLRMIGRLRRLLNGTYHQRPFGYEIYTQTNPAQRVGFHVAHPTCVWYSRAPRRAGGFYRRVKMMLGRRTKTPS
ncbi:MAG: glycosyltransferase family 2 protein [Verrucomicrobiota bacterium]